MAKFLFTFLFSFIAFAYSKAQWAPVAHNYTVGRVQMLDAFNGYLLGQGGLHRTSDGGITWTLINADPDSVYQSSNKIYFKNINEGFIAGYSSYLDRALILRTADGGYTWAIAFYGPLYDSYFDIQFATPNYGIAVGYGGLTTCTNDGGMTWANVPDPVYTNLESVSFDPSSPNKGLIATASALLRSNNYGYSWTAYNIPGKMFRWVQFVAPSVAYARTNFNELYKTTDAGVSWQPVNSNLPGVSNMQFVNTDTGYALGANTIYRTTNGGQLWEAGNINTTDGYVLHFYDEYLGFAGGKVGRLFRTTNAGGNTWRPIATINLSGPYTCHDSTYTFNTVYSPNYTYQWLYNNQSIGTSNSGTAVMQGTYSYDTVKLIVSNGINSDTAIQVFYTEGSINIPYLRVSNDSICRGTNAYIYVDASLQGAYYQLMQNGNNIGNAISGNGGTISFATPQLSSSTTYTIRAYKNSSCGYVQSEIQQTITVVNIGGDSINVLNPNVCAYGTGIIEIPNSQIGVTYTLYNNNTSLNISTVGNGSTAQLLLPNISNNIIYDVAASIQFGCTVRYENVVNFTPTILDAQFLRNEEVYVGQDISLQNVSNGSNSFWRFDTSANILTSNETVPSMAVSYNSTGIKLIGLKVTNQQGCSDSVYKIVRVHIPADTISGASICKFDSIALPASSYNILAHHVDRNGNQYIAGYRYYNEGYNYTGSYHYYLQKLDADGNRLWEKSSNPTIIGNSINLFGSAYITGITSDPYGNIYIAGSYSGYNFVFDSINIFTPYQNIKAYVWAAKLDTAGHTEWLVRSTYSSAWASDILYVDSNHLLIPTTGVTRFIQADGGTINISAYNISHQVLVLNSQGAFTKSYPYSATGNSAKGMYCPNGSFSNDVWFANVAPKMYLRKDGQVAVIGNYEGSCRIGSLPTLVSTSFGTHTATFAALLNPYTGWKNAFNMHNNSYSYAISNFNDRSLQPVAAVDDAGNIYLCRQMKKLNYPLLTVLTLRNGQQFIDSTQSNILMSYTPSGQLRFASQMHVQKAYSIVIAADNSKFYVGGNYMGIAGFKLNNGQLAGEKAYHKSDGFIAAYDSLGRFEYVNSIGNNEDQKLYTLSSNCNDILVGIGETYETAQILNNTLNTTQPRNFFLKYDASGSSCLVQNTPCTTFITTYDTIYNCYTLNADTTVSFTYVNKTTTIDIQGEVSSIDTLHTIDTLLSESILHAIDSTTYTYVAYGQDAQWNIDYSYHIDSITCIDSITTVHVYTITDSTTIIRTNGPNGLNAPDVANSVSIYPNPGGNTIHIISTEPVNAISVYDMNGALLLDTITPPNNTISVIHLSKGVYLIDIKTKKGSKKIRWVKL